MICSHWININSNINPRGLHPLSGLHRINQIEKVNSTLKTIGRIYSCIVEV